MEHNVNQICTYCEYLLVIWRDVLEAVLQDIDEQRFEQSVMPLLVYIVKSILGEEGETTLNMVEAHKLHIEQQAANSEGDLGGQTLTLPDLDSELERYIRDDLKVQDRAIGYLIRAVKVENLDAKLNWASPISFMCDGASIYVRNLKQLEGREEEFASQLKYSFNSRLFTNHDFFNDAVPGYRSEAKKREAIARFVSSRFPVDSIPTLLQYMNVKRSQEASEYRVHVVAYDDAVWAVRSSLMIAGIEVICFGGDLVQRYDDDHSDERYFKSRENDVWVNTDLNRLQDLWRNHPRVNASTICRHGTAALSVLIQSGGRLAAVQGSSYCEIKFNFIVKDPGWSSNEIETLFDDAAGPFRLLRQFHYTRLLLQQHRQTDDSKIFSRLMSLNYKLPRPPPGQQPLSASDDYKYFHSKWARLEEIYSQRPEPPRRTRKRQMSANLPK